MWFLIIIFLITSTLFSNSIAKACDYASGVSLRNEDNVSYKIHYSPNPFTTRICWIKNPKETVKNGVVGAHRRSVDGFKVIENRSGRITAIVAPNKEICCICVDCCTIKIDKIGEVTFDDGKTIVIRNGKIFKE